MYSAEKKRAVCDGVKNFDTDISVRPPASKLRFLTRYPFSDIEKNRKVDFFKWKHSDENHFWISDDGALKAYYRMGVGVRSNTAIKVVPRGQKQGLFCVFLERVHMELYFDSVSFVNSAFDDIECKQYKTNLMGYMERRHRQGVGTMMQKRGELLSIVSDRISALERGAVRKDKINLKVSRIQKFLHAGAAKYSKLIFDEIVSLNQTIKPDYDLFENLQHCEAKLKFSIR